MDSVLPRDFAGIPRCPADAFNRQLFRDHPGANGLSDFCKYFNPPRVFRGHSLRISGCLLYGRMQRPWFFLFHPAGDGAPGPGSGRSVDDDRQLERSARAVGPHQQGYTLNLAARHDGIPRSVRPGYLAGFGIRVPRGGADADFLSIRRTADRGRSEGRCCKKGKNRKK